MNVGDLLGDLAAARGVPCDRVAYSPRTDRFVVMTTDGTTEELDRSQVLALTAAARSARAARAEQTAAEESQRAELLRRFHP